MERQIELNSRLSTHNDTGYDRVGQIVWDADVVVLGGLDGSPLLVVDANGIVKAANAIQVRDGSGNPVTPVVTLLSRRSGAGSGSSHH